MRRGPGMAWRAFTLRGVAQVRVLCIESNRPIIGTLASSDQCAALLCRLCCVVGGVVLWGFGLDLGLGFGFGLEGVRVLV